MTQERALTELSACPCCGSDNWYKRDIADPSAWRVCRSCGCQWDQVAATLAAAHEAASRPEPVADEPLLKEATDWINSTGHGPVQLVAAMRDRLQARAALDSNKMDAERYAHLKASLDYPENSTSLEYEGTYINGSGLDSFCDDLIHDTKLLDEDDAAIESGKGVSNG